MGAKRLGGNVLGGGGGAKRLKGRNDQGGKQPAGKRLGGETTRGGNGLGAKRPGTDVRIYVCHHDIYCDILI